MLSSLAVGASASVSVAFLVAIRSFDVVGVPPLRAVLSYVASWSNRNVHCK